MITKEKIEDTIKKAFFSFSQKHGLTPDDVNFAINKENSKVIYRVNFKGQELEKTNINEIIGIPKILDIVGAGKKVEAAILENCQKNNLDIEKGIVIFSMRNRVVKVHYLMMPSTKKEFNLDQIISL